MHRQASRQCPGERVPTQPLPARTVDHDANGESQTMTSLRWDNVPKPRVERPPLLAPSSKSARRKQKPPNLKDRIEEVGGARIELQDLARSARAAARATSAKMRSDRCSACKARGVTLWQVAGRLVCASCRTANEMAYAPQSGRRQEPDRRKAARKEGTVTAATAEKDIAWAARQGANDRKAGTECRKYKNFLRILLGQKLSDRDPQSALRFRRADRALQRKLWDISVYLAQLLRAFF